jgi:hypothetical protein
VPSNKEFQRPKRMISKILLHYIDCQCRFRQLIISFDLEKEKNGKTTSIKKSISMKILFLLEKEEKLK